MAFFYSKYDEIHEYVIMSNSDGRDKVLTLIESSFAPYSPS